MQKLGSIVSSGPFAAKIEFVHLTRAGGEPAKFALARYNADGTPDSTFGGGDGKVTTDFTPGFDLAEDVALQPDGKIVAAGRCGGGGRRFALARYLAE